MDTMDPESKHHRGFWDALYLKKGFALPKEGVAG